MRHGTPKKRSPLFIISGGTRRSAAHTTPQAQACITDSGPPRISVAALLQLAQWCQQRRGELTGASPCPVPATPPSPPAPDDPDGCRAPEPPLVESAAATASASLAGA